MDETVFYTGEMIYLKEIKIQKNKEDILGN